MKNYKKIASGILALSILSSGYSRCPELFADIAFADNASTVNASVTESNKINSSKSSANTTSVSVSAEDFTVSGTYEETTVTTVPYASYDASLSYQTSETTDSYTPSSGINLDEKTGILTISEDMNYNTDMENFITANSDKIKSVVIEDGIYYADISLFSECKFLEDITIPKSVYSINYGSFAKGDNQPVIKCYTGSTVYKYAKLNNLKYSIIKSSYSGNGWTLDEETGILTITNSYYSIGELSDYDETITSIVIKSGTSTSYGSSGQTFSNVTKITIPKSITQISKNIFKNLPSLTDIVYEGAESQFRTITYDSSSPNRYFYKKVPENINIEYLAMTSGDIVYVKDNDHIVITGISDSTKKSIVIPAEIDGLPVTHIAEAAFMSNYNLKSVEIPEGITDIGNYAFAYTAVEELNIPSTVTNIGKYIINNAYVNISENNSNYSSQDGAILNKDKSVLIYYPVTANSIPMDKSSYPNYGSNSYNTVSSTPYLDAYKIPDTVVSIEPDSLYPGNYVLYIGTNVKNAKGAFFSNYTTRNTYIYYEGSEEQFKNLDLYNENSSDVSDENNSAVTTISETKGYAVAETDTDVATATGITTTPAYTTVTARPTAVATTTTGYNDYNGEYIPTKYIYFNCVEDSDGLVYSINDDNAEFAGLMKPLTDIEIKESINGIPVTSISANTFYNLKYVLSSIVIPDTISELEKGTLHLARQSADTIVTIKNSECVINELVPKYSICGYKDSTAHKFAEENNLDFYDIENFNTEEKISGDFKYVVLGNGVKITGCSSSAKILDIPEKIEGKTVIKIDSSAFRENNNLTEITIPDTVKTIGSSAFQGCLSLKKVNIPESVVSIGNSVFSNCIALTEVTIPASITSEKELADVVIDEKKELENYRYSANAKVAAIGLFSGCTSLKKAVFSDGTRYIPSSIFYGCTALTDVTIPDSVEKIESSAFAKCSALMEIVIPDSVKSIESSAFSDCTLLENIKLSENLILIDYYVFSNCTSITDITIPDSVKVMHGYTFSGCTSLKSITLSANLLAVPEYAFYKCTSLETIEFPESVKAIKSYAFSDCSSLDNVIIPESITFMGDYSFARCTSLSEIKLHKDLNSNLTGSSNSNSNYYYSFSHCFEDCTALKKAEICDGIQTISDLQFAGCTSLTEIIIPDSVKFIQDRAFIDCPLIENIEISANVESISSYAFNRCTSLKAINVSEDNNYYASKDGVLFDKSFSRLICYPEGKKDISEYILPENTSYVESHAFDSVSLESIRINYGMYSLYSDSFYNCSSLKNIDMTNPSENSSYYGNNYIVEDGVVFNSDKTVLVYYPSSREASEYVIPDTVNKIDNLAFGYCKSLQKVTIPESVETIGIAAFKNCTSLTEISIPESVSVIGSKTFMGCTALENADISLNEDISSIPISMFEDCQALSKVSISGEIDSIYEKAFKNCISLDNIIIPDSVTAIYPNAFNGCKSLKSIGLPENLTSVNSGVFKDCISLSEIDFPKSLETISDDALDNTAFLNEYKGEFIVLNNGMLFRYNGDSENVVIPDNVSYIGPNSLGSHSISAITIPASVEKISPAMFNTNPTYTQTVYYSSDHTVEHYTNSSEGTPGGSNGYSVRKNLNLIIYGEKDSEAEKFALEYGYTFKIIGEPDETTTTEPVSTSVSESTETTTEPVSTSVSESSKTTTEPVSTSISESSETTTEPVSTSVSESSETTTEPVSTSVSESSETTTEPVSTSVSESSETTTEPVSTSVSESSETTTEPVSTSVSESTTEEPTDIIKFNGLEYKIDTISKTATLIDCEKDTKTIIIPEKILEYTVTSITFSDNIKNADDIYVDDSNSDIKNLLKSNDIKYSIFKSETVLIGDIDGDGEITSADALTILQNVVELREFTESEKIITDVDGNGDITSADALAILQNVVELREDFNGAVRVVLNISEDNSTVISKEYYDESDNHVDF